MTLPVESTPELLALHAVRLKGMADDDEVAARFNLDPASPASAVGLPGVWLDLQV